MHTSEFARRALAVIGALRRQQRIRTEVAREIAQRVPPERLGIADIILRIPHSARHLDLGAVHPQRVDTFVEQSGLDIFEVDLPS